jgi:hypothetical protein
MPEIAPWAVCNAELTNAVPVIAAWMAVQMAPGPAEPGYLEPAGNHAPRGVRALVTQLHQVQALTRLSWPPVALLHDPDARMVACDRYGKAITVKNRSPPVFPYTPIWHPHRQSHQQFVTCG